MAISAVQVPGTRLLRAPIYTSGMLARSLVRDETLRLRRFEINFTLGLIFLIARMHAALADLSLCALIVIRLAGSLPLLALEFPDLRDDFWQFQILQKHMTI